MKLRIIRDRRSASQTLLVRPAKREQLVYEQAEWLRGYKGAGLADFRYECGGEVALYYDLTGLVSLASYLRAEIDLNQYRRILGGFAELLTLCTREELPTSGIQLDPSYVYVDDLGEPRFVFVPLAGVAERRESLPVAFLHYMGSSHVRFVVPDDRRHAAALEDFASRNEVLSLSALREHLACDLGIVVRGESGSLGVAGGLEAVDSAGDGGAVRGGDLSRAVGTACMVGTGHDAEAGVPPAATFDPVEMLSGIASASRTIDEQGIGPSVRNAVGESLLVSPQMEASAPDEVAGGTTLLGEPVTAFGLSDCEGSGSLAQARPVYVERIATGERLRVPDGSQVAVIGRSATSDIHAGGNGNVSRRHAELLRLSSGFAVRDLGSANGTYVAGHRLVPNVAVPLAFGERFELADEILRLIEV